MSALKNSEPLGKRDEPFELEANLQKWNSISTDGFGNGSEVVKQLKVQGFEAQRLVFNDLYDGENPRIPNKHGDALVRLGTIGGAYLSHSNLSQLLMNAIRQLAPDCLYVMNPNFASLAVLDAARKMGCLVVGQISSYLPPDKYMKRYDLVISALQSVVSKVEKLGVEGFLVPLWFNPEFKHLAKSWSERENEVIFTGSLGRHHKHSFELIAACKEVAPDIKIFANASRREVKKWGLEENIRPPVFGREMFKVLGNSKIVVNRHASLAKNMAVNLRVFEATGMGAILFTERAKNISDLFPTGGVVEYGSIEEAKYKLMEIQNDPIIFSERARVASRVTNLKHTAEQRFEVISQKLHTLL